MPDESIETPLGGCQVHMSHNYHTKDLGTSTQEFLDTVKEEIKEVKSKRVAVDHYTAGGMETIDYIYAKLGLEGGHSFVLGNILKLASRARYKGQFDSDIEKIRNYAVIMQEKEKELR